MISEFLKLKQNGLCLTTEEVKNNLSVFEKELERKRKKLNQLEQTELIRQFVLVKAK
jgi:hypothetical protein